MALKLSSDIHFYLKDSNDINIYLPANFLFALLPGILILSFMEKFWTLKETQSSLKDTWCTLKDLKLWNCNFICHCCHFHVIPSLKTRTEKQEYEWRTQGNNDLPGLQSKQETHT